MNSKFEIILYWSKEDDTFIAEVPELAGCIADGKTYSIGAEEQCIYKRNGITGGRTIPGQHSKNYGA